MVDLLNDDTDVETRVMHNAYEKSADVTTRMCAKRGSYVLCVNVAKTNFRDMRSLLMACVAKFVQSGQGDGEELSPGELSAHNASCLL